MFRSLVALTTKVLCLCASLWCTSSSIKVEEYHAADKLCVSNSLIQSSHVQQRTSFQHTADPTVDPSFHKTVTYKNLERWYREMRQYCHDVPIICFANQVVNRIGDGVIGAAVFFVLVGLCFTGCLRYGLPQGSSQLAEGSDEAKSEGQEAQVGTLRLRDHHLDNAKFVLMATILLTHFVDFETAWPWKLYVKTVLYFNTIGFALISGYFAARSPHAFRSLIVSVLVPLLFWLLVINPIFVPILSGSPGSPFPSSMTEYGRTCFLNLAGNVNISWFLFSLLWWGLLNRLIATWPPIAKLVFAVTLSQFGGAIQDISKISVAMMYFPVFIAGTLLPLEQAAKTLQRQTAGRIISFIVLAGLFCIEFCFVDWFDQLPKWPWGNWAVPLKFERHARLQFLFLFFLLWNTVKAILVMCVCPSEHCCFSEWGRYTLYPYILHPSLLYREYRIRHYLFPSLGNKPIGITMWLLYIYAVVFCIIATASLSSAPVRWVFGCMIQPSWLSPTRSREKRKECVTEATDA